MANEIKDGGDNEDVLVQDQSSNAESSAWSVVETLRGRRVLLTGSTGFLGKVYASMLLFDQPDLEQLYLLIRSRPDETAEERFYRELVDNVAFAPLRERHGDGYLDFIRNKVTVLTGDIQREHLGLVESDAKVISSSIDALVNSAGLTNFNPNLENALTINTLSMNHLIDFVRLGGARASMLHISTCFVAGRVTAPSPELPPAPTRYPTHQELGFALDHEREIEDCLAIIEHTKVLSRDQRNQCTYEALARKTLRRKNIDPDDQDHFTAEVTKERNNWIKQELSNLGKKRAERWGWVNIYTYTKSLGERVLCQKAEAYDINFAIVRPAIIESAVSFPCAGWNEGTNTSAPLCFMIYKGHRFFPSREGIYLDVIPVDMVTGSMLGVTAGLIEGKNHSLYQLGSSDRNPVEVKRIIEMTTLGSRKYIDKEVKTPQWQKWLRKSMDSMVVEKETFEKRSVPGIHRAASGFRKALQSLPSENLGGLGKGIKVLDKTAHKVEKFTSLSSKIFEMFMPFIYDNRYIFRSRNISQLVEQLPADEAVRYGSPVEGIDWRHYWMEIHLPGLEKLVFPDLTEKLKAEPRIPHTYATALDLFDASTRNFSSRVAFQHHAHSISEIHTYGQVRTRVESAARRLQDQGIAKGDAVLILGENRPEWPMSYFALMKVGAVVVPVDAESTDDEVSRVAASANASFAIASASAAERIQMAELNVIPFSTLFSGPSPNEGAPDPVDVDPEDLASLIFTSGTTGQPKGVMLTHRNFTSLLTNLNQSFRVNERDGFLSVLPLHHTFEFTCGLLMPFSRGARITYLEEVTGDELRAAMKNTRVTAMIGVPALWQLLQRRIDQKVTDAGPLAKRTFQGMASFNQSIRETLGVNLGPSLFGTVHKTFGGNIRYLISGGAALPDDVMRSFYGMGFNLYEGYGLTEAAPVLAVNKPGDSFRPGTVGKALPDVELKIHEPNDQGVGEVIARGPNIMRGYFNREEETNATIRDGWLHTGDLGTISSDGTLKIVGRSKEIIITSGGKNVYPDELEELYAGCEGIDEIAVVGLPDGSGSERVGCLIRPTTPESESIRQDIRQAIRVLAARLPGHKRIQVIRFTDEELPRTATRKVKRREVVALIEGEDATRLAPTEIAQDAAWAWLYSSVASLAGREASSIHPDTDLADDLGFDSLTYMELASILGTHGHPITSAALGEIRTVSELENVLESGESALTLVNRDPTNDLAVDVPAPLAGFAKKLLYDAQMRTYRDFYRVGVYGRAHIPHHDQNILVVANHCSHLDMGLVKYALGDYARDIRALAAADYFFDTPGRRLYFQNFTNLIPIERAGSIESSLQKASEALEKGEMILLFPEGTRSPDGKLRSFRPGLGYLALSQNVSILPIYLEGTHRALGKGKSLPSITSRSLNARIGPLIDIRDIRKTVAGQSISEQYATVGQRAHDAIASLRDRPRSDSSTALEPLLASLNDKFEADQVDHEVSYYFSLGAVDEEKWTVVVDPAQCTIRQGKPPGGKADCVVKTTPKIFRKIVEESYVPSMDEFMSGVIKTNSPDLLMRFQSVFRLQG